MKTNLKFILLFTFLTFMVQSIYCYDRNEISKKVGIIERVYQFPISIDENDSGIASYYILNDGCSFYRFSKKNPRISVGDTVILHPLDFDDDDDNFITVEYPEDSKTEDYVFAGWTSSEVNTITETQFEEFDGDIVVFITLDDGTLWQFVYDDEDVPHAKFWHVGEEVVLLVESESPPFPIENEAVNDETLRGMCRMINLNSDHHFAGESAEFIGSLL